MKYGVRKVNLKSSLKARTTGRARRSLKRASNPLYGKSGMGFVNNPKKAVYNKVYSTSSVGVAEAAQRKTVIWPWVLLGIFFWGFAGLVFKSGNSGGSIAASANEIAVAVSDNTMAIDTVSEPVAIERALPEDTEESGEEKELPPDKYGYTYSDMDAVMYTTSSLNVRALPSKDGEKLGTLAKNDEVVITGVCHETGWYRIDYMGFVGFVSGEYLSDAKEYEPAEVDKALTDADAAAGVTPVVPADIADAAIVQDAASVSGVIVDIDTGGTIELPAGTAVWIPATGRRFHRQNDCGNMNPSTAKSITVEEAKQRGYTACHTCYQ